MYKLIKASELGIDFANTPFHNNADIVLVNTEMPGRVMLSSEELMLALGNDETGFFILPEDRVEVIEEVVEEVVEVEQPTEVEEDEPAVAEEVEEEIVEEVVEEPVVEDEVADVAIDAELEVEADEPEAEESDDNEGATK